MWFWIFKHHSTIVSVSISQYHLFNSYKWNDILPVKTTIPFLPYQLSHEVVCYKCKSVLPVFLSHSYLFPHVIIKLYYLIFPFNLFILLYLLSRMFSGAMCWFGAWALCICRILLFDETIEMNLASFSERENVMELLWACLCVCELNLNSLACRLRGKVCLSFI